ncbi:cytochrome P450 97B3 [Apiospora arundinis]
MKLAGLTIASFFVSAAIYYVHSRSLFFLGHFQFYVLLWCVWLAHAAGLLFYSVILWPKYLSPLRHLPEPTEGRSWWNGYGKRAFFGSKGEPVAQWNKSVQNDGIFRYLDVLNIERVAVTSPELVGQVLARIQDFEQSHNLFRLAMPILGPGIVLINGEEHKRQRKLLAPLLATKEIRELDGIFWGKSLELLEQITDVVAKTASATGFSEPICVDHYAGHVTLDGISKAALGMDFESLKNPNSEIVSNYRGVFEPTAIFRFMAVCKIFFPRWLSESIPLQRVKEAKRAIELIHNVCRTSAQSKMRLNANKELTTPDLISCLVRDRGVTNEEELVTHSMQMLGAGHETVGVGITWGIYEFCRQAKWQQDIRAEVRANLPQPGSGASPPKFALEPDKMPLLNAYMSECLRYWPPVGQIGRMTAHDTVLHNQLIPKGTTVHVSIRSFNRNPVNWGADAGVFKPERWLRRDEATGDLVYVPNGGALTKQALMTFIHGGRDCIGRVFARSEMLHVLATLVGRFEFVLTDLSYMDETTIPVSGAGFAYKPRDNIYVHARQIPGW